MYCRSRYVYFYIFVATNFCKFEFKINFVPEKFVVLNLLTKKHLASVQTLMDSQYYRTNELWQQLAADRPSAAWADLRPEQRLESVCRGFLVTVSDMTAVLS